MDEHCPICGGNLDNDPNTLGWGQREIAVDSGLLWIFALGWVAFFGLLILKGGV